MLERKVALFISVSSAGVQALKSLDFPQVVPLWVATPNDECHVLQTMVQWLPQCQFIFLDLMGVSETFVRSLESLLSEYHGALVYAHGDHLVLHGKAQLGSLRALQQSPRAESRYRRAILQRMGNKATHLSPGRLRDLRNEQWLCSYWKAGTSESISQMLVLLAKEYGFWKYEGDFLEPMDLDTPRIQWPEENSRWENWEDFVLANPQPSGAFHVVLLYVPHRYPQDTHPVVRALARAFQKSGVYVTPLAAPRIQIGNQERIQACLPPSPDVLVNLLSFRLGQGPTSGDAQVALDFLCQLNIPLLHPFILGKRTISQWKKDPHGTTPAEFLLSIYLPEMDGAIETIPIAALDDSVHPPPLALIADRVMKVVQRAKNWATLRHKPNESKRLAILLYDYPPGEGRLGQAAFLDTTESLSRLLQYLHSEGYGCPTPSASELREYLPQLAHVVSEAPPLHPCTQATTERWGAFPGNIYSKDQGVALPGWLTDNVFLTLQPPRKQGVVSAQDYHQEDLEPHHQYLAMYHYIAHEFKADALIHIGTHGTLEFTPGKENAPSRECFPDYLVGNIPHVYVYYSGNPSEAMIAKRRSHAVLVGHAQAPMAPGGLYGAMLELDVLLQEYAHAGSLNPSRQSEITHDIEKAARSLGWNQNDPDALHERLNEMKQSLIPTRLHIMGQGYSEQEVEQFVTFYQHTHPEFPVDQLVHLRALLMSNQELESVGRVLAGGYLEAGLAGDPFRNLEVLPSGRNLLQMDPRHIPSPAAERNGRALAEKNAMAYQLEHGVWPKNVAVILWGLETSKTQGESVAMILQYLGVRLRRESPWKMDLECIPLVELGRPRIDVQVQISGFLRDLFPAVIHLIDSAVELVVQQKESFDENPIVQRTAEMEAHLRVSGSSSEDAYDLARARVFGPKPGLYGTAVNGMVKSAEWQHSQELAEAYLFSMRYVYTRQRMGEPQPKLLRHALRDVQLVSQVRGGQDYEVTDLDHYYEFLGGVRNSIVALGGPDPMMRICDSLCGGLRSEDLAHSIQRGVRSRLLNPLWQEGMLKSEFHGAQQFAERMENLLGLSALTGSVDSSLWSDVAQSLVLDPSMRERLQQNNPMAARQVAEKILETLQRGLWEAPEGLTEKIQDALMEMEE